jgi:hypothetical protein
LVRKDVECVFGILKKRFLLLKHPIRLHDAMQIQRAFVSCGVLHNILLDYDMYNYWHMDKSRNDVDYGILEESSALRAVSSQNSHAVTGVRSNSCEGYLNNDSV